MTEEWDDIIDGVDWRRLPFEIVRAVEQEEGILLEQLHPGLALRVDGDEAVVVEAGHDLCRIPMWRLADVDPERVVAELDREPELLEPCPSVGFVVVSGVCDHCT